MYKRRYTPEMITHLGEREIFVFGSVCKRLHKDRTLPVFTEMVRRVRLISISVQSGGRESVFRDRAMPSRPCMEELNPLNHM